MLNPSELEDGRFTGCDTQIPGEQLVPIPSISQQMLIRKPVERVFEAFINPNLTTRFWFTHSSGSLAVGETVLWEWRMYGVSTQVDVLEIVPNQSIKIEWGEPGGRSIVEWAFASRAGETTLVTITNSAFQGNDDSILAEAIDSMGGFSFVLAGAKAFLEHDLELNLIHDHVPDAHVSS